MTTRLFTALMLVFLSALPALAERPRPLGWAMEAMRDGNWDAAQQIAEKDGAVAAHVASSNFQLVDQILHIWRHISYLFSVSPVRPRSVWK